MAPTPVRLLCRSLVLLAACAAGILRAAEPAPPVVPLWAQGAPGSEAKRAVPEHKEGNDIAGVHNPTLTVFLPAAGRATGAGVIVMPGGGHRVLVVEKEGYTIARALAAKGIAAFVLKYRLAKEAGSTYRVDVEELADAQRALRLVRSRAAEWGVRPDQLGVMGFSAGGELAALVSLHADAGRPASADPIDHESSRSAFQALIYPGGSPGILPQPDSPPAFLACGVNDRPDISEGVPQLYLRFKAAHVPVELHVYAGIGHGFGLRPGPSAGWLDRFADWLHEQLAPPPPAAVK